MAGEAEPSAPGDPVTFVVRVDGSLIAQSGGPGVQAAAPAVVLELAENLLFAGTARLLLVVAADPGSLVARVLAAKDEAWMAGRVWLADADPDMGMAARAALARELGPGLGERLAWRIGQRTATFADVLCGRARGCGRAGRPGPGC
ncbi:MAG: hypothetical protein ACR2FU_14980 [Streptosporangiaceae bacterium]